MRAANLCLIAMLLTLPSANALAKNLILAQADTYIPLFSQDQISKAPKDARKRMQDTEQMNHDAWLKRRQQEAEAEAEAKKAAESNAAAPPPPPDYSRKGKIFKWVDAQGRVHFGDAPSGSNAKQIKLRNIEPPKGAAPPAVAPHLKTNDKDT